MLEQRLERARPAARRLGEERDHLRALQEGAHAVDVERAQRDHAGRGARERLGTVARRDDQRAAQTLARAGGQRRGRGADRRHVGDELAGRAVRRVEIVDDDADLQQAGGVDEEGGDRVEERGAALGPRAAARARDRVPVERHADLTAALGDGALADRLERRDGAVDDLDDRAVGRGVVHAVAAAAGEHREPARGQLLDEGGEEPALADAGIAGDDGHATFAGGDRTARQLHELGQLLLAPETPRANRWLGNRALEPTLFKRLHRVPRALSPVRRSIRCTASDAPARSGLNS